MRPLILLALIATPALAEPAKDARDLYEPLRAACARYGFKRETEAFAMCVQREYLARRARFEAQMAREQQREDASDLLLLQLLLSPTPSERR